MILALIDLLDPETLISRGGLLLVALIVFAESGLLIGFMLPGDSLLFVAGFLASDAGGNVLPSMWIVAPVVVAAAIAGDQVGYLFGRRVGTSLATRPKSRWFDPNHIDRASAFFDRHGPKTIVLARFVPVVRTFAPIVAGIGTMPYRTFVTYNVLGGLLWGAGLTFLGWALGGVDVVREHVEIAILGIVALSLVPPVIELIRHRRRPAVATAATAPVTPLAIEATELS